MFSARGSKRDDPVGVVDKEGVLWKATRVGSFAHIPEEGVTTIWESITTAVKRYPTKNACGWRDVLTREMETVDGKSFEKLTLGPYNWLSYSEFYSKIEALGSALVSTAGLKRNDPIVIFADTQKDWMVTAYAAWRQGLQVVTIYATLGEEGAQYGISQTRATVVVADSKLLKLIGAIAPNCKALKHVITIGTGGAVAAPAGVSVHSLDAMVEAAKKGPLAPATPSKPDECAIIMYTSGTTGVPKGVMLSHANVMALSAGTVSPGAALMNDIKPLSSEDVYLAYLPLAHIMELAVEITLYYLGMSVGYGSPHTLTPSSVKMKQTTPPQKGDAMALSPTVMVFAPAVLDKVYAGIKIKVKNGSSLKQTLFGWALDDALAKYDAGGVGPHWLLNSIVFKPVQALLGGRVRCMLAGSAPLSADVQKFVQSCFAAPLRQGYGLTETCAATCLSVAHDNTTSQVGPPQESACIRLKDWEEGGYRNADRDVPSIGMRRGEILIGGPAVCMGYYVAAHAPDPEVVKRNQEDFVIINGARFFCTGDIGQFTASGCVQIIDRKKDLVKLQQGEYVALSKVENVMKNSPFTQIPMVYALSSKSYCIALLCPQPAALKSLGTQLGMQADASMATLCSSAPVVEAVLKDITLHCKAAKLASFETPTKLILVSDEWTVENEMLTTTMKIKRKQIVERHKQEIDAVYK